MSRQVGLGKVQVYMGKIWVGPIPFIVLVRVWVD